MISTNAIFARKQDCFELEKCVIKKVIKLSGLEYDSFARNMLRDRDFIKDNVDLMRFEDGAHGCLLVVGEGRRDGIIVDSSGSNFARYSAFIPNAESFLLMEQYPALAELNRKLIGVVDYIADQIGKDAYIDTNGRLRSSVEIESVEAELDIELSGTLLETLYDLIDQKPEIEDYEIDNNELILYSEPKPADLSDPSVTRLDMNVYGYDYDGMIPLGKERALELFDAGHEIFRLYEDDTEGAVDEREEIEEFDGLFGIEHISPDIRQQEAPFEVLLLNWDRYHKGEQAGEWLPLPADADKLIALLERIGVNDKNDSFAIVNVRMPMQELLRDHVSKHDSLDELNMLATMWGDMAEFEHNKLQAILSSGVHKIGCNITDLINTLCDENFDAFRVIDATDYESLGRSSENEDLGKPEELSFEEFGRQIAANEGGKFTEHGYIYFRNKDLLPEYTGAQPDEYKILGMALQSLRSKQSERGNDEKPSVVEKIRAARSAPRVSKDNGAQKRRKSKEGQEL